MAFPESLAVHSEERPPTYESDLVIVETRSGLTFILLAVALTFLALITFTFCVVLHDSRAPVFWILMITWHACYGGNLLERHLRRYRVREHGHFPVFLSIPPMSEFRLLQHVATSPELISKIAPSRPRENLPIRYLSLDNLKLLLGLSLTAFIALAGRLLFIDGITLLDLVQFFSTLPILIFSILAIRRMKPGNDHSKMGLFLSKTVDLNCSKLGWDFVLGQAYLRIESNGETYRYYNPTRDSLYLLRLMKYGTSGSSLTQDYSR